MTANEIETRVSTIGELKAALKLSREVYVWCNCYGDDGEYIETTGPKLLRSIGADVPFHRDGRHNDSEFYAIVRDGAVYVHGGRP